MDNEESGQVVKDAVKAATIAIGQVVKNSDVDTHFFVLAVSKNDDGFAVCFGSDITNKGQAMDFAKTFLDQSGAHSGNEEIMHVNKETGEVNIQPLRSKLN